MLDKVCQVLLCRNFPKPLSINRPYIDSLNLFETFVSYSKNHKERTTQYQQEEARRYQLISSVTNMEEYLRSLEMNGIIKPSNIDDVSIIAQLTQGSNQFSLKTKRYTEKEIKEFMNSKNHLYYAIKLKDKFGVYGVIPIIIIEKTVISPTLVISG
ncbi:hypothetical protein [Gelidibacter japonicus]|uniref:hypothetical protein n=1 Tax=Gelidibacter japonicus TaxID=1962232 RepID=UPI003A90C741